MNATVTINDEKLSRSEINALKNALDIYCRLMQGMFAQIGSIFKTNAIGLGSTKLRRVERLLKQAQIELFGSTSVSKGISDDTVTRMALVAGIVEAKLDGNDEAVKKLKAELRIHTPNSKHNNLIGDPSLSELEDKALLYLIENKSAIADLANDRIPISKDQKELIKCLALHILEQL